MVEGCFGPLAVLALLMGALRGTCTRRILSLPFVSVTGGMCYSFYLWHGLWEAPWHRTAGLGRGLGYTGYFALQCLWILPGLWILCATIFRFLEKPFMARDWPQRLRQWLRGQSSQSKIRATTRQAD